MELRHRGKVLDSTSGVQGRLHGTVLCAACLEGRVGAGKAEDPRGGHSGRGSSAGTEVREDCGSQRLQAMWCGWKICCMRRVLTDGAGKISSIQSGCVYSVRLLPRRLAQSLSGSRGSINVGSVGMKDRQGLDQEVNQILVVLRTRQRES